MLKIGVLQGDGIGPELVRATRRVLDAACPGIEWIEVDVGDAAVRKHGHPLPPQTIRQLKEIGLILKGPMSVERFKGRTTCVHEDGTEYHYPSINNAVRRELDLFVATRQIRGFPGISGRHAEMDVVIMRELTEGIYAGLEHQIGDHAAEAIKLVTREAVERLTHHAFAYARKNQRRRITCVHKANALSIADGFFLKCFRETAAHYAGIEVDDCFVDAAAYHLARNPQRFDVIVTDNQYGDILSDLAGGLAGSLGLAPGANIGHAAAMFEATHGSAPDIAGKGICNPVSLVLSGAALLNHAGRAQESRRVEQGVRRALAQPDRLTPDLGGSATTEQLVEDIVRHMD